MTSINGSNVHEAFALMATLLAPCVPVRYLEMCGKLLQRRQMEEVFEERAAAKRCAFPACENSLPKKSGKFRVSLARKAIYDAHYERQFCSPLCLKTARLLLSRLAHKPPQLVPSLVEVFGTDKPNPIDYDGKQRLVVKPGETIANRKPKPLPMIKTVWAKTRDLGIVERNDGTANALSVGILPAPKATTSIKVKENASPAAPERTFPTADHASLVEGYVFPAHKQDLAKKMEKWVNKQQKEGHSEKALVLSDNDESDAAASDALSVGSFELSDFDDNEVITLNDLPLFGHLWALFSNWVTHETTLVVARLLPQNEGIGSTLGEIEKREVKALCCRAAQQIHTERWNSLSLMLRRPVPQVARKLNLAIDCFANHRMDTITRTFSLRDAIDTRNPHLWTCAATILLLVTYNITPKDLLEEGRREEITLITRLDKSELEQLLQLFYIVRKDSDVIVDTDVAPTPAIKPDGHVKLQQERVANNSPSFCRRCLRLKAKCICEARAKTRTEAHLSSTQLRELLQQALVLRERDDE